VTKRLLIGLFCVPLTLVPALAQNACLTFSEGLRCVNELASPTVNDVMRTVDRPSTPAWNTPENCRGPGSVFLHASSGCGSP
jgi:hypothetical protein